MKLKKFISGVTAMVVASLSCGIQGANCKPIETDALNEQLVENGLSCVKVKFPKLLIMK